MLNIAVDPALTFNLFRVFAALACIAISGFLLVYFAFGLRYLPAALATAFPIGFSSTLLVSNLLAYVLGTPRAFALGLLAVLAIASTIALLRRHSYSLKPSQPLPWLDGGLFIGAGIAIFILSVVNYVVSPVWEYSTHFWLANTIRFGNFPVMAPGAPNLLAEYHYGGAFLAAMLSHIGQVDSAIIFFFLTPLAATIAYLAASVLAASVLKNIRLGLLAGIFFSFGSGLPYPIDPIRSIYLRWFTPSSAAAEIQLADTLELTALTAITQYPRYLADPHFLLAGAILLSVIILTAHLVSPVRGNDTPRAPWHVWLLLGALFASVALIESLVFTLGFIGWSAYALWQTIRERTRSSLVNFVLAAAPAALLATFQGGILTSVLFSSASGGTGPSTAFYISFKPLPFALGNPLLQFASSPPWVAIYLASFGIPLLAAPALLVWAIRSKHSVPLVWLAAIGFIGIVLPHFVIYHFNTLLRWMYFGYTSQAFLLGIGALTLVSQVRRRWMAWILFLTCAALTIGWPLATSIKNIADERFVTLGQSTEDHWTISALHRQSDNMDWLTGRPYVFLMGAEARQFLRSLPSTARVLTNRFPEVPLLIRGLAPHKNTDVFSYTNFRYPSPTYFDAINALDPLAMEEYGITHIVINHKWFRHTSPQTHAILQNPRYFSLLFSDEEKHDGFAWHHVYQVLPAFFDENPSISQDLLRSLPQLVPQDASVYISPAIPVDIRWALLYVLREQKIASAATLENHINVRLSIAEPQPNDHYDFALLIDEPPGERWLNWAFTSQDLPSVWGFHSSQRVWHALGVGLYALNDRVCPSRSLASVPPSWHLPANSPSTLNLDCLQPDADAVMIPSSVLLTILSPVASQVEITANGSSQTVTLEPGATLVPLNAPGTQQLTVKPADPIWLRAQRVPPSGSNPRSGVPALQILPSFDGEELRVQVHVYGERKNPLENQLVWELVKQRRIYGHWWHWVSRHTVGVWRKMLETPLDQGNEFSFTLDFETLESSVGANGKPTSISTRWPLPRNPGEPYVLYLTLWRPGDRTHSFPVAWITYAPGKEPTVLLAPRFILLDQAPTQQ